MFQSRNFHRAGDLVFASNVMARMFATATNKDPARNYFGLWDEWLLQDLLWHSEHSRKNKYTGLQASPSWSWISVRPVGAISLFRIEWSLELDDEWDADTEYLGEERTPSFKKCWTAQVLGIYPFGDSIPESLSFWGSNRVIRMQSPLMPALLTCYPAAHMRFAPNKFELNLALMDDVWGFVNKPNIKLHMDDVDYLHPDNEPTAVVVAILRCHVFCQEHIPPWTYQLSEAHGLLLRLDTDGLRYRRIGRVTLYGEMIDFLAKPDCFKSGWLWEDIRRPELYLGYVMPSGQVYGHLEYELI
ncbi:hypothetical protein PT974_02013 [Cladobotryum mycophilum]|uniref:Uncharacterized protein n=1 Tax=Cladobotryum mycophilum TaxID=491253 RepID=A0ABR0SX19_9HYPO